MIRSVKIKNMYRDRGEVAIDSALSAIGVVAIDSALSAVGGGM